MDAQLAIQLLSVLLDHLQEVSAAIAEATAAGTELGPDRWAVILASDDRARAALTTVLAGLKPAGAPIPAPPPSAAP